MRIVHGWVSEFVELDPTIWRPERVASVLTDLGLEVEHINDRAAALNRFVVGLVLECKHHPKADKLSVCLVDVGEPEPRTIVCGAPNVAAGQLVPVALDGAVVPNGGFTIGKRMLRGVQSNGMICSRRELEESRNRGIEDEELEDREDRIEDEGLEDKIEDEGIWVLGTLPLPPGTWNLAPGTPLASTIGQTEIVYDVAITPNRADCLSHVGLARELRAYNVLHESLQSRDEVSNRLRASVVNTAGGQPEANGDLINNVDDDLAPIYALQKINNVNIGPSPKWMQDRLIACGLRPRNVIVDVTNYVNMEHGQPLHAFDFAKIRGSQFRVQTVRSLAAASAPNDNKPLRETVLFTTLDGKSRELPSDTLMICDMEGGIAIAGVMGGDNSEIDVNTTDIVIESAYFNPQSIRRTAKTLGLNTDASYRFERGVDPGNVFNALERATQLILDLIPTASRGDLSVRGRQDKQQGDSARSTAATAQRHSVWNTSCVVDFEPIRGIIGAAITNDYMVNIFTAIGCEVANITDMSCLVTPPTWRVDLNEEIDYAEEVMRFYGINNIPDAVGAFVNLAPPVSTEVDVIPPRVNDVRRRAIRPMLVARGYSDCVTTVLTSPDTAQLAEVDVVRLKNPLGVEFSALRTSIVPSLLTVASLNIRHSIDTIRLCEIGSVFSTTESQGDAPFRGVLGTTEHTAGTGVIQSEVLALLITGEYEHHWSVPERELDLFDLLGDLGVIGQVTTRPMTPRGIWSVNSVEVLANTAVIGVAGLVDPEVASRFGIDSAVFAAEISLKELDAMLSLVQAQKIYKKIGQFPNVRRDLALIVEEEISAERIVTIIRAAAPVTCRDVQVFDVYRDDVMIGEGKKSVAIRLTFRSDVKTLVEEEIEESLNVVVRAITSELGAHIRGSK